MKYPTPENLRASISNRLFGENLIQNNLRSEIVEEIISFALPETWKHCAGDWGGWDFEHISGCRLEVKQSAARQTWATEKSTNPRFDIAKRSGYWDEQSIWLKATKKQRFSNIYIFAWHDITDDMCNHLDATQWQFFVVDEKLLPDSKSIGLKTLNALVQAFTFKELAHKVEEARLNIAN